MFVVDGLYVLMTLITEMTNLQDKEPLIAVRTEKGIIPPFFCRDSLDTIMAHRQT
jgi:hypothetical protein